MTGTVSWILSLKAITDALIGLGVLKGKNCQVKSVVHSGTATVITFAWYDDEDVLQETSFTMYDGANGIDGQNGAPGEPGANGVSVVSAEITVTNHLVFTMSDDTTIDAGVISGGGGEGSASWGSIGGTITDQTDLQAALNGKVSTVSGKGLSTNDYTNADKEKVANALTQHQNLSNYYTKSQTDSAIATEGSKYNPANNFKTVNGNSIIGTGNIEISGSGSGGTTVVANPTLSGNEFDLAGLTIGSTSYKVSVEKDITAEDYADLPETKNSDDITYFVENEEVDYSPQIINLTRNVNTEEIYVGTTEPAAGSGYKVWIDPTQDPESSSGGGSSLELLWTNTITPANKTINSSYSAAEFTLDVTAYKHVVIDYIFYAPYNNIITCVHPVGQSSRAYYVGWNSTDGDQNLPQDGVIVLDRIVVANKTGTTFKFYDCSVQGVTNNKCLIPWRIWGMN